MMKLGSNVAASFRLILLIFLVNGCAAKTQVIKISESKNVSGKLIYENDFDDLSDWRIEQMPGGKAEINNAKLEITDVAGCTIWSERQFSGPIMIEYDVYVIKDGGPQDRVSDLNCFWMAIDPENPDNLFANSQQRRGKFSNYDSLKLYYMGVGGNDNKTTRFRRYVGNGERPLLPEYDLKSTEFMLTPNKTYHIKIIAYDGVIQYYRDDVKFIDFLDSAPYTSGHFGFRTVNNHMTIDNFKVYQLK